MRDMHTDIVPPACVRELRVHVVHTQYTPNKLDDLMGNGDKRQQLLTWLAKWGSPPASSGA